jgi:PPP family 3-phenylpropionic acid transporter
MSEHPPRKRLSELSIFRAFYFLLFVPWGISAPFLPLFFKRQGLSDAQVGFLAAMSPFLMVFSPPLWGAAADRTGNAKAVVLLLLAAQGILFPTLLLSRDFHALVLINLVFSFFSVALIPMSDALTFRHLGPRASKYGTIRLWGTLGFVFPLVTMGFLLDLFGGLPSTALRAGRAGTGDGNGGSLFPLFVAFSVGSAVALLAALRLPDPGGGQKAPPREPADRAEPSSLDSQPEAASHIRRKSALHLLAHKEVLVFLAAAFVARLAAQPGFVFFSIYLDELGIADSMKGYLWALGAICEVPIMMAAPRLLERPGLKWLLALAIGLGAARFFALSFRLSLPALLVVQPVLAVTFAGFHIPMLTFVNRIAPPSMQASAQTLFSGLIYGLSGVVGSPLGGWLSETAGIFVLYRALAAVMAVSFLLVCFGVRPERPPLDSAQA